MSSPLKPPKPPKSPKPLPTKPPPPPPSPLAQAASPVGFRPPPPPPPPPPAPIQKPSEPPEDEDSFDEDEPPPPSDEDEDEDETPPDTPDSFGNVFVAPAAHIPSTSRGGLSPVRFASSAENAANVKGRPYRPSSNAHSSIRSSTSSVSSLSSKFRPQSTWSQASSSTNVDLDEADYDVAGYYAMHENALMQNILSKMNRSGTFEKIVFVLTPEELIYIKLPTVKPGSKAANALATITGSSESAAVVKEAPEPSRNLPLSTLLAMPIDDKDVCGKPEKRKRVFKILAKTKSFFVRAPTLELKDQWLRAIQEACSEALLREKGTVISIEKTAPIYIHTESNCQICAKVFTFFIRKNHCHNCGKCVCEMCSRDKMRILKIDDKKLFRVCNPCGKEIKANRVYGASRASYDDDEEQDS